MIAIDIVTETVNERAHDLKAVLYYSSDKTTLIKGFTRYIFFYPSQALETAKKELEKLEIIYNVVIW